MKSMDNATPHPSDARRSSRPTSTLTLVEIAHEHLLSMLLSMQIAPGERIRIDAVARLLGISQTPIREALRRLEAENLVHKVTNVGYRASFPMSAQEVDDLYTLRMLIEPYAAAQAARAMTDDDVRTLARLEKDMEAVKSGTGVAYARFAEADAALHRLIAAGSGNRLIAETIERLHVHLHIFQILFNPDAPARGEKASPTRANAPEEAGEEHGRIIRALLDRDPAEAEAAMRHHLERSKVRVENALRGTGASGRVKATA